MSDCRHLGLGAVRSPRELWFSDLQSGQKNTSCLEHDYVLPLLSWQHAIYTHTWWSWNSYQRLLSLSFFSVTLFLLRTRITVYNYSVYPAVFSWYNVTFVRTQFDLPYLQILRVKEFKFREVLGRRSLTEVDCNNERSLENLMQVRNNDGVTFHNQM